jgi:hypothetical protein
MLSAMKVRARIELFAFDPAGRAAPLHGSFRPNHCFSSKWFVVGEVQQPYNQSLAPGECANLLIEFVADGLPPLSPGLQWDICEGPDWIIGRGTVREVLRAE